MMCLTSGSLLWFLGFYGNECMYCIITWKIVLNYSIILPWVLWCCWLGGRKGIHCKNWVGHKWLGVCITVLLIFKLSQFSSLFDCIRCICWITHSWKVGKHYDVARRMRGAKRVRTSDLLYLLCVILCAWWIILMWAPIFALKAWQCNSLAFYK